MDKIVIETRLRQLGSSGLLRGHWDCIDILYLCAEGAAAAEAVSAVAALRGVSARVVRRRICSLMRHMERVEKDTFSLLWAEGEQMSADLFLSRVMDASLLSFCDENSAEV